MMKKEELARIRKSLGLTQKELAEKIGYSFETIKRYETGERTIPDRVEIATNKLRENKMEIIAIINQKGGVGKTTTSINLSSGLAITGKKVLLVDMDPQANSSKGLGLFDPDKGTVSNILLRGKERTNIQEVIRKTEIEGLDIITSSVKLEKTEQILTGATFREQLLKQSLQGLKYDYIIIDCGPRLGILNINALVACNKVIVPCKIDRYSLEGFGDLIETIMEVKELSGEDINEYVRIVLTMVSKKSSQSLKWVQNQLETINCRVMKSFIRQAETVNQAHMETKPIFMFDPKGNGSQDYESLVDEVVKWQN